jgi:ATP-dependent DNA helicase RecQ
MEGKCVLYYSHKDVSKLEHLMRDKSLSEREVGAQLINETVAYAESSVCRRKTLLYYFGEDYDDSKSCGHCDNCLHPKEKVEAKDETVCVLKTVDALGEQFAIEYVLLILTGKATPAVKMYRHEELDVFACGNDKEPHLWNSLIRQMLLHGLLEKDIVEYGVLKITKQGRAFMKKPTSFKITLNNLFEDANADDEDAGPVGEIETVTDVKLLEQLNELRKKVSKDKNLPPFVIFLESSLEDMATMYPTTMEELEKISGVSKGKSLRYGKPFLDLIIKYVEENDVIRPDDFVMKSVVNKNNNKIFIIQNVDKKITLETIAKNKSLKLEELLEEMETIVASGTKLNLGYAIDEMVDEYEQEEIMDYFKGCQTSDLKVAQQELSDGDFTWEQLKLMRIKFLSEYGN